MLTKIDKLFLPYFIGYFYQEQREQILKTMSSLSLNTFGSADTEKKKDVAVVNKALRFRSYDIESLEISKCQLTVDVIPLLKALLTACCSINSLTLQ